MKSASPQDDVKNSPKYFQARNSLPDNLREVYDSLVDEYRFYALTRYGRAWVAYDIIADLVKSGWRPSQT
jgi:hypothetical protein